MKNEHIHNQNHSINPDADGPYRRVLSGLAYMLCAREISCNGKRGKSLKWLFYAAYPLQFLVLYGISYYK